MKSRLKIFGRLVVLMMLNVVAAHLPAVATATSPDPMPASSSDATIVDIETEIGRITLRLYPSKAPLTVANFLRYVDARNYDGGTFYRSVRLDNQSASDIPIQVVQGGLFGAAILADAAKPPDTFPPIEHETTRHTGLTHVDGTISMARAAPGTASSEFFICISDNPALDFGGMRNPDGQGFAAFGRVIAGMEVVRKIHRRSSSRSVSEDLGPMKGQVLDEQIAIVSVRRAGSGRRRP
jgi:peptidyl-prolyl cis-trans isomerase A (cyclophilin A)